MTQDKTRRDTPNQNKPTRCPHVCIYPQKKGRRTNSTCAGPQSTTIFTIALSDRCSRPSGHSSCLSKSMPSFCSRCFTNENQREKKQETGTNFKLQLGANAGTWTDGEDSLSFCTSESIVIPPPLPRSRHRASCPTPHPSQPLHPRLRRPSEAHIPPLSPKDYIATLPPINATRHSVPLPQNAISHLYHQRQTTSQFFHQNIASHPKTRYSGSIWDPILGGFSLSLLSAEGPTGVELNLNLLRNALDRTFRVSPHPTAGAHCEAHHGVLTITAKDTSLCKNHPNINTYGSPRKNYGRFGKLRSAAFLGYRNGLPSPLGPGPKNFETFIFQNLEPRTLHTISLKPVQ